MIAAIVKFCIRERLVVAIAAVALLIGGWFSQQSVPLDAIPNVGENQVIVLTEWPGQSPKDIEDQVTYPLSVTLQSIPGAIGVRGRSMFGFSFVQVTFKDDVDFYWARSRVTERLLSLPRGKLPPGVTPVLAPDATALGQIYYYVLEPPAGMDLAELRSLQDFVVKLALESVEGVAEVASIGGYRRQYQVEVDPQKLQYFGVTLDRVLAAVRASHAEVGAKTVETSGYEFLVRGRGFLGSGRTEQETIEQIEETVVRVQDAVPLRVRDVATVQTGPAFRIGALDLNGVEAVGGIVVMRYRENPRDVIERVKLRLASLERELQGVKVNPIYDRTELIEETSNTLQEALLQEIVVTCAIVVLFLLHIRSSLIVALCLPLAVLMSFIAMKWFGVDANIMSLAGIAIAIGTMVDMAIIVLENIYDRLAQWEEQATTHAFYDGDESKRVAIIEKAAAEITPAVVTAVSTTVVSFLPVFYLSGRDFRLFAPLAWTKTFAIIASLIVAITLVPMLCRVLLRTSRTGFYPRINTALWAGTLFGLSYHFIWGQQTLRYANDAGWISQEAAESGWMRALLCLLVGVPSGLLTWRVLSERLLPIERNPISRLLFWLYGGRLRFALHHKALMLSLPALLVFFGIGAWLGLPKLLVPFEQAARWTGAELNDVPGYVDAKHQFMGLTSDDWIALEEGSWFYMPSLYPAASFSQSMEVLQTQDAMLKQIPEVADVLGKIGRAESALDPAPVTMIETYIMLKPKSQWRSGVTFRSIWDEINQVATLPGVTLASPLQPIEGRVVMLASGIKASMAIRIFGDSLESLGEVANAVADQLRVNPLVDARTVNPDIVLGKPYLEFEVDREEAARFGMTTAMVNEVVAAGLGGVDVVTTVEGRERYPVQVRYQREVREQLDSLPRVPVVTPSGEVVPLEDLVKISSSWGPGMISSENSRLVAHVMFSPSGRLGDIETVETVMKDLQAARQSEVLKFPEGSFEFVPVGSFEEQVKSNQRLLWLGPLLDLRPSPELTPLSNAVATFADWTPLGLVPIAIVINFFLLYFSFRDVAISLTVFTGIPVAFAGGMIATAVAGVEMNTAIWVGFIALFGIAVDDGVVMATYIKQRLVEDNPSNVQELRSTIFDAGMKRVRPCLMTTATTLIALLPVILSEGRGADVARAMAIPVFGGMLAEPLSSFVVPTIYCAIAEWKMKLGLPLSREI